MDIGKELDELFGDPLLDVSDKELTLFNMPADMKRAMESRKPAEHVATRTPCEDFDKYRPLFMQVQKELREGKRSLIRVSKTAEFIEANRFFVIDGLLVYVESIGKLVKDRRGHGHNKDARTHCIYENGMESDILIQSLRRAIYADGFGITESQENIDNTFHSQQLSPGDKSTGYVYVLRSLSPDPEIAGVKNLYKIGFTSNTVEERIANAEKEPTYLMAPVQIVETAQIVNMNSHIFETIVHQVFSDVQFQLKVYDEDGILHIPTEWFVVPHEIVNLVIQKIVDGTITQYAYNAEMQCLEKRLVKKKSTFKTEGLKVLTLNTKEAAFQQILKGVKTCEHREIKQSTINKYTYIDEADGKRYLRSYDVIRFLVGSHKKRDAALVEVTGTTCTNSVVEFKLGRILEHLEGILL